MVECLRERKRILHCKITDVGWVLIETGIHTFSEVENPIQHSTAPNKHHDQ